MKSSKETAMKSAAITIQKTESQSGKSIPISPTESGSNSATSTIQSGQRSIISGKMTVAI